MKERLLGCMLVFLFISVQMAFVSFVVINKGHIINIMMLIY